MINLCRIFGQKCALFINHSVDTATYFIIMSCSLHLKTAFGTIALMTVYTAEYTYWCLLVYCRYNKT